MQATQSQFLPFLDGKKQFIIPIYQRTYSWTREQCTQLWNDVVKVATHTAIKGHFIGSIVYIRDGLSNIAAIPQFLVIDGQQRMTTLSLLLLALARTAQNAKESGNVNYDDIFDSYLINKHGRDEYRYKLLLTQSDKHEFISLLDDKHQPMFEPKPGLSSATGRLTDNYHFFEEQIQQSGIDLATLYIGISKLIVVDIILDRDHDNPQLIFESLNSTGMDLSQADLIRNYVLMGLDNEVQASLYKEQWYPMEQMFPHSSDGNSFDRFMRDYLTLEQGTIPNIDKVYVGFKSYHQERTDISIEHLVADIYRYATHYVNFAFLWEGDSELKRLFGNINALKVDVIYPFLLEVYDDYAQKRVSRPDFITILKLLESYLFRRAICGIPTNTLNKVFATLAKELDKEHYVESLQRTLLQKDSYRRFPGDDEFRSAFVMKDVYNFRLRNYLLRKLENAGQKELVNIESCTIEHIMPQNPNVSEVWQQELGPDWKAVHNLYLHTIGNLTLTGYNSELSDRPFQEKRTMTGGFEESPLRLNKSLKHVEHWNKDEIERRAAVLAEQAVKIWEIPHIVVEQGNNGSKLGQKTALAEVIGPVEHPLAGFKKNYMLDNHPFLEGNPIFEELRKRILNLDASVAQVVTKNYIAYKMTSNFVAITGQKKRLVIGLYMPFANINDPKGLCKDISDNWRYGKATTELSVTSFDQVDDVMDLIRQAFEQQMEIV